MSKPKKREIVYAVLAPAIAGEIVHVIFNFAFSLITSSY